MKSVVFFNNKGGVGKTTLACNVVAYLNMHFGKRVLLVDTDPQCNATQAILNDRLIEKVYIDESAKHRTIYSYLKPLEDGEPTIDVNVKPMLGSQNRYRTDIIPGHPHLSIIEDRLSDAWQKLLGNDTPGYRITNWCTQLLTAVESSYDIVVFDVGPSLGALNRTVILSCDYIVAPFGCDIFSLLGIQNISKWIKAWNRQYQRSIDAAREDNPEILQRFPIVTDTSNKFRLAGYSVQQYIKRKFKEGPRPVRAYDRIMQEIPSTVTASLDFLLPAHGHADALKLGDVPFVYSLVPLSQTSRAPIHALTREDRLMGPQYKQVEEYSSLMTHFCTRLLANIGVQ